MGEGEAAACCRRRLRVARSRQDHCQEGGCRYAQQPARAVARITRREALANWVTAARGMPHRVWKPLSRRFWAFWGGWAESEAAGSLVAPELDPRRGRNTPGFGLLSEELDCLGGWRIEPGSGWRRAPTTTAPGSIWTDLVRPPRLRHLPADASSPGGRTSGPAKLDRPGGRTTDCAVRHHCPTSRGNTGLPADCPGRPSTYFRLGGRAFTRSATGRVWRPRRKWGAPHRRSWDGARASPYSRTGVRKRRGWSFHTLAFR